MRGARDPLRQTQWRGLLWLSLPAAAFFVVFHYIPMGGLVVAFKDFQAGAGVWGSPWVGGENFARLFGSDDFLRSLWNTVVISVLRLAFGFAAPIVLALLLNELHWQGYKRSIQTLTYIPHFLSWVILGGIFLMLFSLNGPVNHVFEFLSLKRISFLSEDGWFLTVLIITGIWQSAGYGAVIYLAALSGISPTLYEAAVVDGANRWQQVRHITLPGLAPTITVLLILSLSGILNAGFDQIYNLYNPLVYDVADILDTFILRRMMESLDLGLATAAGLLKSLVGMLLVVLANMIARRATDGEQGIW